MRANIPWPQGKAPLCSPGGCLPRHHLPPGSLPQPGLFLKLVHFFSSECAWLLILFRLWDAFILLHWLPLIDKVGCLHMEREMCGLIRLCCHFQIIKGCCIFATIVWGLFLPLAIAVVNWALPLTSSGTFPILFWPLVGNQHHHLFSIAFLHH